MNYIYDYCAFYLGLKTTYNFFLRVISRLIKKVYKEEKTRYWILTTRTAIYGTFIPSLEHPPIYIKEGATLKRCQKPFCLKHYLEKIKEWYKVKNKNNETVTI